MKIAKKDPRFIYVMASAYHCNRSLSEIKILADAGNAEGESELVSGSFFTYYKSTLYYCFNAEYTKLLEPKANPNYPKNHIASLFIFNEHLHTAEGQDFDSVYEKNKQLLNTVKDSDFYERQRSLRNKKFSHADMNEINDPLKMERLTPEEIAVALEHMKLMYTVLNNCCRHFDFETDTQVPHRDSRTRNFINLQSKYKQYYFANYPKIISERSGGKVSANQ